MKDKATVELVDTPLNYDAVPVLLKFQNGDLMTASKDSTKFSRTKSNHKESGALVVANGHIFHGPILNTTEEQLNNEALTDTYICVRNRLTNKVRIVPVSEARLSNSIYNKMEQENKSKLSSEVSKNELIKKFGGRRAMRYVNDTEKSKINVDMVKDNLDKMVTDATVEDDENDGTGTFGVEHYDRIRPAFNKEAKTLSEIYNIYDVIPKELLNRMDEEAKTISATQIEKLPINSVYLRECLSKFQTEVPSNERELKIKVVLYMDCLLNLLKSRSRTLGKIELSAITEKVENDVRLRFGDSTVKKFSKTAISTEKAFCYFMILALLISDKYEVNINVLKSELSAARAKIIKYANIINARIKFNSDTMTLCLPSKIKPLSNRKFKKSNK